MSLLVMIFRYTNDRSLAGCRLAEYESEHINAPPIKEITMASCIASERLVLTHEVLCMYVTAWAKT